ncbi:MAG: hypothetical protein VKN17_04520 [Cyanobacteriota bacterium]|nr:hypothetical protein [Cyanobacteriota bacterium]
MLQLAPELDVVFEDRFQALLKLALEDLGQVLQQLVHGGQLGPRFIAFLLEPLLKGQCFRRGLGSLGQSLLLVCGWEIVLRPCKNRSGR